MSSTASSIRSVPADELPRALSAELARHRPGLVRWVSRRLDPRIRGRVDPSDVVQDVCVEAFRRIDHFRARGGVGFLTWLRSLARDRLVDLRRAHLGRQRRSVMREVHAEETAGVRPLVDRIPAEQSTPSHATARAERSTILRETLPLLSPTDRQVIELREFDGLSNGEVARRLGLTETAASARAMRALSRLGALLRARGLS